VVTTFRNSTAGYFAQTVPASAAEAISVGKVVFFRGAVAAASDPAVRSGLLGVRVANANIQIEVDGQLGLFLGTTATRGNAVALDKGTVLLWGFYSGLTGAPALGAPVFVGDTGSITLVPGTYVRQVGEVVAINAGAGTYDILFTGGQVRPVQSFDTTSTAKTLPIFTSPYLLTNSYVTQDVNDSLTLGKGLRLASVSLTVNDGATSVLTKAYTHIRVFRGTVVPSARNIELPARPNDGFVIIIKDADNSAAASNINVTTSGVGVTINNAAAPYVVSANGRGLVLVYDFAEDNWDIVAQF
jgi:hypothetical protein